ncbi:hypothetical protein [Pontibacter pudoricolor]|uniref:hypothetical protein n=1 Tax=Pontibacter pudoricolor TaxID=2694930 RepID=UPI0013911934|nr:hypothetical protein [Pontibacter pudoricolor]
MIMVKTILSALLLFTTSFVIAQSPVPEAEAARQNLRDLSDNNNITGVIKSFDRPYEGIKGTPFFGNTWNKTSLSYQNKVIEIKAVKYNVYDNNILFKDKDGKELILDVDKIPYFIMVDSVTQMPLVFKKLNSVGKFAPTMTNKFALVLHEGKAGKLINIPEKILLKANYKGGYNSGRAYNEFVSDQSYYFIKNDIPEKVKLNKKSLLSIVLGKEKEIETYLKTEKIDAGTEQGWVETLTYYETL